MCLCGNVIYRKNIIITGFCGEGEGADISNQTAHKYIRVEKTSPLQPASHPNTLGIKQKTATPTTIFLRGPYMLICIFVLD